MQLTSISSELAIDIPVTLTPLDITSISGFLTTITLISFVITWFVIESSLLLEYLPSTLALNVYVPAALPFTLIDFEVVDEIETPAILETSFPPL